MLKNYKAIILAGGLGTRFNQNKKKKLLKPLVKVKNLPILERVIRIYKFQGIKNFILLGGYKYSSLKNFSRKIAKKYKDINIKVFNTGIRTNTAGRLLKIKNEINQDPFFFTYGDSLANFNVKQGLKKKMSNNFIISIYKYKLPYGETLIKKSTLKQFNEKNKSLYINAGFYILDKSIFDYIRNFKESFENKTIKKIINDKRKKFKFSIVSKWHPMDDIGDRLKLDIFLRKNAKIFK